MHDFDGARGLRRLPSELGREGELLGGRGCGARLLGMAQQHVGPAPRPRLPSDRTSAVSGARRAVRNGSRSAWRIHCGGQNATPMLHIGIAQPSPYPLRTALYPRATVFKRHLLIFSGERGKKKKKKTSFNYDKLHPSLVVLIFLDS